MIFFFSVQQLLESIESLPQQCDSNTTNNPELQSKIQRLRNSILGHRAALKMKVGGKLCRAVYS